MEDYGKTCYKDIVSYPRFPQVLYCTTRLCRTLSSICTLYTVTPVSQIFPSQSNLTYFLSCNVPYFKDCGANLTSSFWQTAVNLYYVYYIWLWGLDVYAMHFPCGWDHCVQHYLPLDVFVADVFKYLQQKHCKKKYFLTYGYIKSWQHLRPNFEKYVWNSTFHLTTQPQTWPIVFTDAQWHPYQSVFNHSALYHTHNIANNIILFVLNFGISRLPHGLKIQMVHANAFLCHTFYQHEIWYSDLI